MAYLLPQLLAESAARYPDQEAVAFKDRWLTYAELDALSNRFAHVLRRHGVARGDRVGLYVTKAAESVAAIFGILKAGATYVPLDPGAPAKRIAFIVGNCAMKALIGSAKKIGRLYPALADCPSLRRVLLVGADAPPAEGGPPVSPWREVLDGPDDPILPARTIEDDLAYVLYTSGSTGEPKGVMISHRASLTFIDWAQECFRVGPGDRLSNHAPFHFDLSVLDLFVAAKAGACVDLVPEELSVFPVELANFIERRGITVWYSVPSVLTRLVLHGDLPKHRFPKLRTVLFAGEVFPTKYLRQLMALVPHPRYYNLYGPTETNVCTYYPVGAIPPDRDEPISIGAACANTDTFVVADDGTLAGPGEVGELYVRGPSLMKGYWGLPERTAASLVRRPAPPLMTTETVYRTGDLVRQTGDGNYQFLGRRDSMIKSRGYRIELGEIETVLYRHPKVEEAAVLAIPDEEIGNRIKAVVVGRDSEPLNRAEIEAFCAEHVPKYMVPGSIEFRTALPKTSTGKIDKALLVREELNQLTCQ